MKIQTLMTTLILAASGAAYAQTTAAPSVELKAAAPVAVPATVPAAVPAAMPAAVPAAEVKAAVPTPALDKVQAAQQSNIEKGVASGELNAQEGSDLMKSEAKLDANKKAAKADGKVTAQEKKKLKLEANANAKAISKQKTDKPVLDPVK